MLYRFITLLMLVLGFTAAQAQTSRTLYDKNGKKVLTYTFVYDISTDCSVPDAVAKAFPADTRFYDNLFSSACQKHDWAWSQAPWQKAGFSGTKGKDIADERFKVDMQKACDARFPNLIDAPRKGACYTSAEIWYAAVKHKIDEKWQEKQSKFTKDQNLVVTYSSMRPSSTSKATSNPKASANSVWGVNKNDNIYYWNGSRWTQVSGALKSISVGSDGTVWGVNSSDQIYRRNGSGWTKVSGALKQISVGNRNHVWGVNANDNIYYWNGSRWTQVSGKLKHVSVGTDGTVWGVNSSDQIFRRNGSGWTRMSGALKQISVGNRNQVWGVNKYDQIFRWNGSSWTQVKGALKYVSVANDGTVWGVNKSDKIYKYNGGSSWTNVNGLLKVIDAKSR